MSFCASLKPLSRQAFFLIPFLEKPGFQQLMLCLRVKVNDSRL
jgi:hypothetical protein